MSARPSGPGGPRAAACAGACVIALLALPAANARPDAGASSAATVRLDRLVREAREHRLATRPDLATLDGDRRGDARLEPVTPVWLAREAAWTLAFAPRLDSIPVAELPPAARARRDALAASLARARVELVVERRWERDPAAYLELADTAIRALLARRSDAPCARARLLTRRLARVPEVLRAARVNLSEPPRERVCAAVPGFERALELYRSEVPRVTAPCREPRVQADLAEADTLAVRAVADFLDYLREDVLPRTTEVPSR